MGVETCPPEWSGEDQGGGSGDHDDVIWQIPGGDLGRRWWVNSRCRAPRGDRSVWVPGAARRAREESNGLPHHGGG